MNGGTYNVMNASEIVFSGISPSNIPLSELTLTFLCDGQYGEANASQGGVGTTTATTILIQGSLASMTWYPGYGSYPSSGPKLGYCANFNAGGYGGGAFGVYFNRLGLFDPIRMGDTTLQPGDTYILYVHTGCTPLDQGRCDADDYHGAPPWCFTDPGACTIQLTYNGGTPYVVANIPVTGLAPPST